MKKAIGFVMVLFSFIIFSACVEVGVKYNIDFYADGELHGNFKSTSKILKLPDDPQKDGYTFDGWFWDEDDWEKPLTLQSLLDQPIENENNYKVYAKFYKNVLKIEFVTNCTETLNFVEVDYDEKITEPTISNGDKVFDGWYTDADFVTKFDFNEPIKQSAILYAKWKDKEVVPQTYEVKIFYNFTQIKDEVYSVEEGEYVYCIDPVIAPDNMEFDGWYTDAMFKNKHNFDKPVTENITIYAKWIGEEVFVSFIYDGHYSGGIETRYGELVKEQPDVDVYVGHYFDGWYKDAAFTKKWDFDKDTATKGLILHGKSKRCTYTIIFKTEDILGYDLSPIKVEYESRFELPNIVSSGKAFSSWYYIDENGHEHDFYTFSNNHYGFAYNIEVYPRFVDVLSYELIDSGTAYRLVGTSKIISSTVYALQETKFTIPSTYNGKPVTEIGDNAIYSSVIKELIIPSSITKIGNRAFVDVHNLEKIIIADSVESIGEYAFQGCYGLKEVVLPSALTVISKGMFNCTTLEKVTIGDNIDAIADYAFSECTELSGFELPKNLVSIGVNAFNNCVSLGKIFLPKSVLTIGKGAFGAIYDMTEVMLFAEAGSKPVGWDNDWKSEYLNVFWGSKPSDYIVTDGFDFVLYTTSGTATLIRENKIFQTVAVPQEIVWGGKTYTVNKINRRAFYGGVLRDLTLPNTIEYIGENAFAGCSALKYYEEGDFKYLSSVTNKYFALVGCSVYGVDLVIKKEVKIIMPNVSISANTVDIEDGSQLVQIGTNAFSIKNSTHIDFYLPSTIKYIDERAFTNYTSFAKIHLSVAKTPVGWGDNWNGGVLVYYDVENTVVSIDDMTYYINDGAAEIIDYVGDDLVITIPRKITVNETDFAVTSIATESLSRSKTTLIRRALVPNTVTYFGKQTFVERVKVLFESETTPDLGATNWLFLYDYMCNVAANDYIVTDKADYILTSATTAKAYIFNGKNETFYLPRAITVNDTVITINGITSNFLYSLNYVNLIVTNTVTTIFGELTYTYSNSQIFTEFASKPSGWVIDDLHKISVTYGVAIGDGVSRTYSFVTSGTAVEDITTELILTSPETTLSGKYFWGWYDNDEYQGDAVKFPYSGEKTTLYALFMDDVKRDGTSFDNAYILDIGVNVDVDITNGGQLVYFKLSITEGRSYIIKSTGDCDTFGTLCSSNKSTIISADGGGSNENFSITRTLTKNYDYYLVVKLTASNATGSFKIIVV